MFSSSFGLVVDKRSRNNLYDVKSLVHISGHLTGCGGVDPHNLPTSVSSAPLGHFTLKTRKLLHISKKTTVYHPQQAKIGKRLIILMKLKQRRKHAFCS